jgi:formyl-CoA transferase
MPTGVYRTRNGYLNLAATGQRIWTRFCAALGAPELATHPDYVTGTLRGKNRAALCRELEARLATEDTETWLERLHKAQVPCGPINAIDKTFADPQVRHLGIVQSLGKEGGEPVAYLGQPVTLSRTPARIVRHSPERGEQTVEILRELGLADADIEALRERQII